MACLFVSQEVVVLFNDVQSRVTFPSPTRRPSDFLAYRPPQAARTITTARIFCNESTFATVSSAGEIFTFNNPTPPAPNERLLPIQPQRVWTLRKQWSAVHVRCSFISFSSLSGTVTHRTRPSQGTARSLSALSPGMFLCGREAVVPKHHAFHV
jgi:hypothetical protein